MGVLNHGELKDSYFTYNELGIIMAFSSKAWTVLSMGPGLLHKASLAEAPSTISCLEGSVPTVPVPYDTKSP